MKLKNSTVNQASGEILKPKNDVVFQALFTRGKESITKSLIENILKIKIDKLELDKSKDLLNNNIQDKNGRLDLRVVIDGNIECDIEMQLTPHEMMLERFLCYWAKMYTANFQIGEDYRKLRKTISIIIVDDEIKEFKEIKKSQTKWQIREEKYVERILTQYFEIDIIELPKAIEEYKNNKENGMLQWMMFLDNPENMEVTKIMESNEDIKDAKEELDKISQDEILRRMAIKAQFERADQKELLYEARRDGLAEGQAEGEKKAKLETAKKMLEEGIELELVIKITGLEKEEILNNK